MLIYNKTKTTILKITHNREGVWLKKQKHDIFGKVTTKKGTRASKWIHYEYHKIILKMKLGYRLLV